MASNISDNFDMDPGKQAERARAQISQLNATSPLLRLPAEIRNEIFALALSLGEIEFVASHKGLFKDQHPYRTGASSIGLLYVCRQIHFETALLPYQLIRFSIWGHPFAVYDFLKLRTLDQIRVMKDVQCPQLTGFENYKRTAAEWMELGYKGH